MTSGDPLLWLLDALRIHHMFTRSPAAVRRFVLLRPEP